MRSCVRPREVIDLTLMEEAEHAEKTEKAKITRVSTGSGSMRDSCRRPKEQQRHTAITQERAQAEITGNSLCRRLWSKSTDQHWAVSDATGAMQ